MRTIILLDVDGVLIRDRGYRASAVATIDYFAAQLGLSGMAPADEEIDAFHASGYTNEWDLSPFAVGILRLVAAQGGATQRPDYRAWAERTGAYSGRPSQRALAVLLDELDRVSLPDDRRGRLKDDFEALLADTYDVQHCPTTQVFQEYVLGSSLYAAHYALPPRFASPSFLEQEDEPALKPAGRDRLERLVNGHGAEICIYTARPSGPPSSVPPRQVNLQSLVPAALTSTGPGRDHTPLPPEAEVAVRMLNLGQYPLIAMGRMQWLATRTGESVEALTKPSPVQLLAALGAAISKKERAALEAAYALYRHGQLRSPLADLADQPFQVFVLEDAALGLQAAANGLRLLEASGLSPRMRGIGVTISPVKAAALTSYCERVVSDVNDGLTWIEAQLTEGVGGLNASATGKDPVAKRSMS